MQWKIGRNLCCCRHSLCRCVPREGGGGLTSACALSGNTQRRRGADESRWPERRTAADEPVLMRRRHTDERARARLHAKWTTHTREQ